MITEDKIASDPAQEEKTIIITCPQCTQKKKLKIPVQVINQAKQLTTISVPSGICCEHGFQAFVDKNFKIRGYQRVDFEFSKMEILESTSEPESSAEEAGEKSLTSLPVFQEIIQLLRNSVDDSEILGSGLFTLDGHVLYSSLPKGTLTNTMREFEVRNSKKLVNIKKMFLELINDQKICCNYINLSSYEVKFVLVLFFSSQVKLGMGNLYLRELSNKISEFN